MDSTANFKDKLQNKSSSSLKFLCYMFLGGYFIFKLQKKSWDRSYFILNFFKLILGISRQVSRQNFKEVNQLFYFDFYFLYLFWGFGVGSYLFLYFSKLTKSSFQLKLFFTPFFSRFSRCFLCIFKIFRINFQAMTASFKS